MSEPSPDPAPSARTADRPASTTNVLLVDDDEDILRLLSLHLQAAGLAVDTARSGGEALSRIESHPPELVVADVRMPGMSGYELCRQVRAQGHEDLPFLFCSALDGLPERIKGLRHGADEYLPKSMDPEELVLRVKGHLERARRLRAWKRQAQGGSDMLSGSLEGLGVPDLFQILDLFAVADVRIHLERPDGIHGTVWLAGKRLVHAETGALEGRKAFARMLSWSEGRFRIDSVDYGGEPTMEGRVEACLLENVARLDECRQLRYSLEAAGGRFELLDTPDLPNQRRDASTARILELIATHHDLDVVLDLSPLEDLETLQTVAKLLRGGVIVGG